MMFRTMYDERVRVFAETGKPEHPEYQLRFDDNGEEYFEVVGMIDTDAQIQSHALSCDINVILKRYADGDLTALSRRQGIFMDATGMPTSIPEMLNLVISGEEMFNSLPLSVREKFDMSYTKWIASMSDFESWQALMSVDAPHGEAEKPEIDKEGDNNA